MSEFMMLGQADAGTEAAGTEAAGTAAAGETTQGTQQQTQSSTKVPAPGDEGEQTKPAPGPRGLGDMMVPLLLMLLVMYFVVFRGPKKKQQQQKQMLADLKKNDRVRTIGGIIGTVVDLRDNEVVIKIDESNNTKMRLVRNAIHVVLTDDGDEKKQG